MLIKIGERLALKTRGDCSEEFTVEKLDDQSVTNHSETINRQCELVVLHSAVQVSWNDRIGRC